MYALPLESKLDILKNLNINQLTSFRQTNHYFNALIGRYEEELARKKFDIIEFADFCCVGTHKFINIEDGVFKLEPTSQLLDKWQTAVDRQIPVYSTIENSDHQQTIKLFEGFDFIILNLPIIPKNFKEIKIIRFWIEKISRCYFDNILFSKSIFNPEIIQLIFENEEIDKIKFNGKSCNFHIFDESFLFLNHLGINEFITLNYNHDDFVFNQDLIDILIKFLMRIPKISIDQSVHSTLCKLILNHIETSKDYSNIVFNQIDAICLKDSFTLSERAELIKKNQGEDISDNVSFSFTEYTYHLTNMHNRKVKFSIYFMELGEYKVSFRIERISK
ncbi:hypothetical protein ACQ4LE_002448 [Meloidogyne hapla]